MAIALQALTGGGALSIKQEAILMSSEIRHLPKALLTPPPRGWSCVVCRKGGDASELVIHTGDRVRCIFHRTCYPQSAMVGKCHGCNAPLLIGSEVHIVILKRGK